MTKHTPETPDGAMGYSQPFETSPDAGPAPPYDNPHHSGDAAHEKQRHHVQDSPHWGRHGSRHPHPHPHPHGPPPHDALPHRGPPGLFAPDDGPPGMKPDDNPEYSYGGRWNPFGGFAGRGRGGCRGRGRGGFGHHPRGHRQGPWGRWRGSPRGSPRGGMPWLWDAIQGLDQSRGDNFEDEEVDVVPHLDKFESEELYTVHVELPGTKKADVGVHWDENLDQLCISGVVHRLGDEAFIQTLTEDERQIGTFDRKIVLDEQIEADKITAKLEDGILIVEVPKRQDQPKKVDVKTIEIN